MIHLKKRTIIILVVAGIVAAMAWSTTFLSLSPAYYRDYKPVTLSDKEKMVIAESTQKLDKWGIVNQAIVFCAKKLRFAAHNHIASGEANCVGYAQLCATVCNYAFDAHGIPCKARPVVGSVRWLGIDLCNWAYRLMPQKYKGFVKDHDFVEIDWDGDKTLYVDPCLYDVIGNKVVTFKDK